jgi:two-component sensor histidine kinase
VKRGWALASAFFAVSTGIFVTASILSDRAAVIKSVQERTQSLARMIVAHGDAAVGEADKVIRSIDPDLTGWDLSDPVKGRELYARLRNLIIGSGQISSAWILDEKGISRLDTWAYPSRPIDANSRPYFIKHKAGFKDLLVAGDERPGTVTGRERFTVSRPHYNPDGTLHAVIVVGIYTEAFNTLYKEVANWPDARAGFYTLDGDALARLRTKSEGSPAYFARINANVRTLAFGSVEIDDGNSPRVASWQRSSSHPELYPSSSQTISAALVDWRKRSIVTASTGALAIALFGLFVWMALRAGQASQAAHINELAIREVHHRVKNALQLMVSMISLRVAKAQNPATRAELEEIALRIRAIADVQDLLQSTTKLDVVDPGALLARLCEQLQKGYPGTIRYQGEDGHSIDAAKATSLAIIANELVTNAMKHGDGIIDVSCQFTPSTVELAVSDNGPGLPENFDVDSNDRFGLRVARTMAESIGGRLTASNEPSRGATFRLELPEGQLAAA